MLRSAAIVYALFTLGHTLGGMLGDTHRGPQQAALFAAMRAYSFEVQGATRTYWDFYRGFGFMVSVFLTFTAALCWILGDIGRTHPREARRVLLIVVPAMAATAWLSFVDFFAAPAAFSLVGVALLIASTIALGNEASHERAPEISP